MRKIIMKKIKIKENKYEKLRFKFYEGVNKFIFFKQLCFMFIVS